MDLRPHNWRGTGNPNPNATLPDGFTTDGINGTGNPYPVFALSTDNDTGLLNAWMLNDSFVPTLVAFPATGPVPFYLTYQG